MSDETPTARPVDLEIHLDGGHHHRLTMAEDSPLLADLFRALASGGAEGGLLQLPMQEGRTALSFHASRLVSVVTRPPVVVQLEAETAEAPLPEQAVAPFSIEQPGHIVIDNFLSPVEHRDMLAWALANQERFQPGTVSQGERATHRENLVIMDFSRSAHAALLKSRLLTWFPALCRALGEPVFALDSLESQLTAANEGQYYRTHNDSGHGETSPRVLTCVYYFFREPKGFSGGELRLYDTERHGEEERASQTFRTLVPVANRLVVFPSRFFHEVRPVSCPSRELADSRFAVTNWFHRRETPDPDATFGWGQLHCGVVPPSLA